MLRRAFQRWLAATRHQRLRRQRLEQKEQQLRFEALGRAWDTWRDKFKEEVLRGTVSPTPTIPVISCLIDCPLLGERS
jgi:AraC-like DNA-binding protein